MAKNDNLRRVALGWFRAWPAVMREDKRAGAGADTVQMRWVAQHGPAQRPQRRDTRAAQQISHRRTQHHGHAPRPDMLWHHHHHGRPKGTFAGIAPHRISFVSLNSKGARSLRLSANLHHGGARNCRQISFIMGSTEPEAVAKLAPWGTPRLSANFIMECAEPETVDKLASWGSPRLSANFIAAQWSSVITDSVLAFLCRGRDH